MDELKKTQIGELMSFLGKNKNDRGVMADLRRGFSRTTESRAWPHIAQFCDLRNNCSRRIVQLIAAGFATCGESSDCGNMGETMRHIAMGNGKTNDGLKTFENRFRRLLSASSAEEICDFLPGIIRTAKTRGIHVNFFRLFEDLLQNRKVVAEGLAARRRRDENDALPPADQIHGAGLVAIELCDPPIRQDLLQRRVERGRISRPRIHFLR